MALCQHHVGKNDEALVNFNDAVELDAESKEAKNGSSILKNYPPKGKRLKSNFRFVIADLHVIAVKITYFVEVRSVM